MTTRQVPLSRGMFATVDPVDFRTVYKIKWHAHPNHDRSWYARGKLNGKKVFMHAMLLGSKGVDHKDGNGLNNTRGNLRIATSQQNARNRRKKQGGVTSKFKGVYLFSAGKWRATITYGNKQHSLGMFRIEEDAARAYDTAAKVHHGEFAVLNFPEE